MPAQLVLKADFPSFVQFSTNIDDRLVNFHVNNCQLYEVEPRLGALLYAALIALPTVPEVPEDEQELRAFYNEYVKRYVCLLSYIRFISEHGTNVTQFGFTQLSDPAGTFETPSEDRRAVFLRQYRSDAEVSATRLFNRLQEVNYTLDGVSYLKSETIQSKSLPISSVKKNPYARKSVGYLNRFDDGLY